MIKKYKIGQAVGHRINQLLFEKNITLTELQRLSKTYSISHITNPKNNINIKLETLYKLASGFGMTVREFLDCDYLKDCNIDIGEH